MEDMQRVIALAMENPKSSLHFVVMPSSPAPLDVIQHTYHSAITIKRSWKAAFVCSCLLAD